MKNSGLEKKFWDELAKRNVAKVVVHFQGGNDEGGVDNIVLQDAAGKEIGTLDEVYNDTEWNEKTKRHEPKKLDADGELARQLVKPVYDKYSSFCGDFYVSGDVTYDVKARTAKISGAEEVKQDEEFEEEL
jgi:hypothetical protein